MIISLPSTGNHAQQDAHKRRHRHPDTRGSGAAPSKPSKAALPVLALCARRLPPAPAEPARPDPAAPPPPLACRCGASHETPATGCPSMSWCSCGWLLLRCPAMPPAAPLPFCRFFAPVAQGHRAAQKLQLDGSGGFNSLPS